MSIEAPHPEIPPTAELVTNYWRGQWADWGARIGMQFEVPDFPGTQNQITQIYSSGSRVIYVPQEIASSDGLVMLGKIFPDMKNRELERGVLANDNPASGYIIIERAHQAPDLGAREDELRRKFKAERKEGMSLSTYIVASHDSLFRTGHHLDWINTWVRLLGTKRDGKVVFASFKSGVLLMDWHLNSDLSLWHLGGRSQQTFPNS